VTFFVASYSFHMRPDQYRLRQPNTLLFEHIAVSKGLVNDESDLEKDIHRNSWRLANSICQRVSGLFRYFKLNSVDCLDFPDS
jgi:hypothetical protein